MTPERLKQILAERGLRSDSATAKGLRLVLVKGMGVSEAARRAGLLQPSLSRSLRRVREYDEASA